MAENGRPGKKGDAAFLVAMAGGATVREAARKANIGERTAYRRLEDPDFRRQVTAMRSQAIERATAKLADASTTAADALKRLLKSKDERVRLSAARWIIRLTMSMRDHEELAERIEQLEAALEGRR